MNVYCIKLWQKAHSWKQSFSNKMLSKTKKSNLCLLNHAFSLLAYKTVFYKFELVSGVQKTLSSEANDRRIF